MGALNRKEKYRNNCPTQFIMRRSQLIDLTGRKFGLLTVLKRGKVQHKKHYWICQCVCGSIIETRGDYLRYGLTKSCGCSRKKPEGTAAFNMLYARYKYSAVRRNYEWKLTKRDFKKLTKQPCHYCGYPPHQVVKQPSYNGEYIYNGIDRINNDKGYTLDNVVPCCGFCNMAKRDKTQEEFLHWLYRPKVPANQK